MSTSPIAITSHGLLGIPPPVCGSFRLRTIAPAFAYTPGGGTARIDYADGGILEGTVTIGGAVAEVLYWDDDYCLVRIPPGVAGAATVTVRNAALEEDELPNRFLYVALPTNNGYIFVYDYNYGV